MSALKATNLSNNLSVKLLLWAAVTVLLIFFLAHEDWAALKSYLSLSYILGSHHVAPWGVLALDAILIFVKRQEIKKAMEGGSSVVFIGIGLLLIGAFIFLIPFTPDLFVLKITAACVGVFAIIFGRSAFIPLVLYGAYAFTVTFPLFVQKYFEAPYAATAVIPAALLFKLSGASMAVIGQVFNFKTPAGEEMSVLVSGLCAGPATMAVFIAIFAMMMIDTPVSWRKVFPLFIFGVLGTWFQNVIRVVIILSCGYFLSSKALWTAHFWTTYIIFPIWYLIFTAVYFKQAAVADRFTRLNP